MNRTVFAQRYHAGAHPAAISEPYGGTGQEAYYRKRTWAAAGEPVIYNQAARKDRP